MENMLRILAAFALSGILVSGLPNVKVEEKDIIGSLLSNICYNYNNGMYLKGTMDRGILDESNDFQNIARKARNVNLPEKLLEFIYNMLKSEYGEESNILQSCIRDETYTDCLRANIFVSMLLHVNKTGGSEKTDSDTERISVMTTEAAEESPINDTFNKLHLKIGELSTKIQQSERKLSKRNVDAIGTSNHIASDIIHERKNQSNRFIRSDETENNDTTQLKDSTGVEISSQVDHMESGRGASSENSTTAKSDLMVPTSNSINTDSFSSQHHLVPVAQVTNIAPVEILVDPAVNFVQIPSALQKDKYSDNKEIISTTLSDQPDIQSRKHRTFSTNESEIDLPNFVHSEKSEAEETMIHSSSKEDDEEDALDNSKKALGIDVEFGNNGTDKNLPDQDLSTTESGSFLESLNIESIDLQDGEIGEKSCSSGVCHGQNRVKNKKTNVMEVSNKSPNLIFGITTVLIILGLAVGAIGVSYFVLQKELPCSRWQRSVNVDQPSQNRG